MPSRLSFLRLHNSAHSLIKKRYEGKTRQISLEKKTFSFRPNYDTHYPIVVRYEYLRQITYHLHRCRVNRPALHNSAVPIAIEFNISRDRYMKKPNCCGVINCTGIEFGDRPELPDS